MVYLDPRKNILTKIYVRWSVYNIRITVWQAFQCINSDNFSSLNEKQGKLEVLKTSKVMDGSKNSKKTVAVEIK